MIVLIFSQYQFQGRNCRSRVYRRLALTALSLRGGFVSDISLPNNVSIRYAKRIDCNSRIDRRSVIEERHWRGRSDALRCMEICRAN